MEVTKDDGSFKVSERKFLIFTHVSKKKLEWDNVKEWIVFHVSKWLSGFMLSENERTEETERISIKEKDFTGNGVGKFRVSKEVWLGFRTEETL